MKKTGVIDIAVVVLMQEEVLIQKIGIIDIIVFFAIRLLIAKNLLGHSAEHCGRTIMLLTTRCNKRA